MTPVWLGAPSLGGLMLPAAKPSPSQMYAPRGVCFDAERLVVADSGNHRVLVWFGVPTTDCADADVVLGQPDFWTEGPKLMHLPTGVLIHEGRLLVADAWHHRVLVWNRIPDRSGTAPDYAIGQHDLNSIAINRGTGEPSALSLYWPYGIGFAAGWFWVADTGNRRVLGWPEIPGANEPAQVVLGQPDAHSNEENRGGPVSDRSFRWPHAIAGDDRRLFVADPGNHRVLGWDRSPVQDCAATIVLGQSNFTSAFELPHVPQGPSRLRFPYAVAMDGEEFAVADTANNRVLLWDTIADNSIAQRADCVLGQDNLDQAGENRWKAVTHNSLCWPYGIWSNQGRIAVADSGNNRVTLWHLRRSFASEDMEGAIACV